MKTTLTIAFAASLLLASLGFAEETKEEKKKELKPQTVCPVMGGNIDKTVYADHEGLRIYFCCAGCDAAFKKEPEKYIKKMAEKGEKPAPLQTICPVMGGKINKNSFIDHEGIRVYVCCMGCAGPFKKRPEKYIKKMQDAGIALDATPKEKKK